MFAIQKPMWRAGSARRSSTPISLSTVIAGTFAIGKTMWKAKIGTPISHADFAQYGNYRHVCDWEADVERKIGTPI